MLDISVVKGKACLNSWHSELLRKKRKTKIGSLALRSRSKSLTDAKTPTQLPWRTISWKITGDKSRMLGTSALAPQTRRGMPAKEPTRSHLKSISTATAVTTMTRWRKASTGWPVRSAATVATEDQALQVSWWPPLLLSLPLLLSEHQDRQSGLL